MCQTKSGDFLGIFFVSTAGQAFEIVYFDGYEEAVVNYITLGGHLEVYFIIRGTADEVIQKYHAIIGKSAMPPFYALGVFQGTQRDINGLSDLVKMYKDQDLSIEGF